VRFSLNLMADEDIVAVKVGDTLGERYKLVRAISAGGMGAVFEAENTWTLRRVALKVLQSHLATDPGAVSRFQSEARLASRVAHPNLIDVLDLGRDERTGTLYLITELLAGRDLRDELAARGRFTPRDALDVMVPVMRALGAAHDKGILHRDVKPANVFLARGEGGAVTPKLIDFGVARALDPDGAKHLTTTGAMVGTILYMAPEQVRGDRDIDGRVDIWAVGAVLFELLTGAPPYPPDGHHTLVWKILSGAPPRLATVAPELPRAVTDAVDRALTHDRELRFATMREFIDALTGAHPLDETHERPGPALPYAPDDAPAVKDARLLLVEDDVNVRRALARVLSGYHVTSVPDGADALALLRGPAAFDLVITDLHLAEVGGMEVVRAGARAGVPVIMITANPTVEAAVQAMRLGAVNFIPKPFTNEALRGAVTDVLAARDVARAAPVDVVANDPGFRPVLDLVRVVADTDATVLLTGETGTGKDVVARLVHRLSRRGSKPFVTASVSSIAEANLERELFGYARAAFSDAEADKAGLVHEAEGGALFFDEIGDMPLACQAKILRLVQEHTWQPVGAARARKADVRILAATHHDLEARVRRGEFRADLYYRLSVVTLSIPPLREHRGDINGLVARFIDTANREYERAVAGIDDDALAAMRAHDWPGNVRELQNVVTRMVIFNRSGRLGVDDLPGALRGGPPSTPPVALHTARPPEDPSALMTRGQFEAALAEWLLRREARAG